MDAPRIQYTKTSDGVSIAYSVAGDGYPLLRVPAPGSCHLQREWDGMLSDFQKPLSRAFRVVWYDSRGCGLSDREGIEFSMEAMIRDLDAVIGANALYSFAMFAWTDGAPIAITYAAQNPGRVTHLALLDPWASSADYQGSVPYEIEEALRSKDTRIYAEAIAQMTIGPDSPQLTQRWMEQILESTDPGVYAETQKAMEGWDVSSLLSEIASPTLVIANRLNRWYGPRVPRLAAQIRDSRLILDETWLHEGAPARIKEFVLGDTVAGRGQAELPAGSVIIFFADIADSTALTETMGDAQFREKARKLDGALHAAISENGGTAVEGKLLGDGVLAVFTSARRAIWAALVCAPIGDREGLPLHLGLHAGDVIQEDNNVYGGAVNIASRISALSVPGEVLVSETVRSLARTSAGVAFEDRGEQSLRGVGEPVRIWAVRGR